MNEPKTLNGLNIPEELTKTSRGDDFFQRIDLEGGCIFLFTTKSNLEILKSSPYWIVDGTFKTVPKYLSRMIFQLEYNYSNHLIFRLFQQFYTIHGRYKNNTNVFPLVYALMTHRTEEYYKAVIEEIIAKAIDNDIDLQPEIIISDFELSSINAVRTTFNGVRTQGCHFHLSQSIFRRIQSENLVTRYNEDEEFSSNLRKISALAFLPASEIKGAFNQVNLVRVIVL